MLIIHYIYPVTAHGRGSYTVVKNVKICIAAGRPALINK